MTMDNKIYYVGVSKKYASIQEAVDAVVIDIGYNTFSSQVEIIIDSGIYKNFYIPSSSFLPTSLNRLIIRGEKQGEVIIEGGESVGDSYGIKIESSNPYVTIKNIEIRNFYIGIYVDTGSDYCVIDGCLIKTCANAGVLARYNDNLSLYNNIILDGDFGVAAINIKNISIVHNTIFNSNKFATNRSEHQACLLLSMADNFGNGTLDTGTAWIRNNIFYNISQYAVIFYREDLGNELINSDYNDYVTNTDKLILVLEKGSSQAPEEFRSLQLFRSQFNIEMHGLSIDPEFIVKAAGSNNYYQLDLSLLAHSPIKDQAQQLSPSPSSIPIWIDLSYVYSDFYGTSRPVSEKGSIGAVQSLYNLNIKNSPNDMPDYSKCISDPYQGIIDKFNDDLYYPVIKSGFFFIEEKKYYLYSNKQCYKLKDCAVSEFFIPGKFLAETIEIYNGVNKLSSDSFDIKGNILSIWHSKIEELNENTRFIVKCKTRFYSNQKFLYSDVEYNFIVKNGNLRILLPEPAVMNGAPVIITDDTASLYDTEENSHQTYSIIYNHIYDQYEIEFDKYKNLINNSAFWNRDNDKPLDWSQTNHVYLTGIADGNLPISSDKFVCLPFSGESNYIYQNIHTKNYSGELDSYRLSFSAFGSGSIEVGLRSYDLNNNLQSSKSIIGHLTNEFDRYALYIGEIENTVTGVNFINTIGSFVLKENTSSIDIEFKSINSNVYLDAIQLTKGSLDTRYKKKIDLNNWSIEYEGSESGFYNAKDLVLSPLFNYNLNGFISINNMEASRFDENAPSNASILNEYNWFYGRKYISPWGRLYGRDKLKEVPLDFNYELSGKGEFFYSPVTSIRQSKEIQIFPTYLTSIQNGNGEYGHIQIYDEYENPMPNKPIEVYIYDTAGKYPGILESFEYGLCTFRGVGYSGKTDSAGMYHFKWTPPSSNDVSFISSIQGYSGNNYIDTKYRISIKNYSNPTLTDLSGNNIELSETGYFSGRFYPVNQGKYNYVYLPYYPVYNSVYLYYNGIELSETKDLNPGNEEFYVIPLDKKIKMSKNFTGAVDLLMKRSYVWVEPNYGRRIFFDSDFASDHTGEYLVNHDSQIIISVVASDTLYQEYSMIIQNNK